MKSSGPIRLRSLPRFRPSDLPRVYRILRKKFGHQRWWPGDTPFEVMVGAILTQNTAWTNVEKAITNLKQAGKLSLMGFRAIPIRSLARLIRPAGYYNIKSDRLKQFIKFVQKFYGGDLNKMRRESLSRLRKQLLEVKGIGPETADSIILYALNKPTFVIDAYTKRIFSRHGLADAEKDYHVWQSLFESALPRKIGLYNDFHAQIVRVGKDYCRKKPKCDACPLGAFDK